MFSYGELPDTPRVRDLINASAPSSAFMRASYPWVVEAHQPTRVAAIQELKSLAARPMQVLRAWSYSNVLATPLPVGLYYLEAKARDSTGVEDEGGAAVHVLPSLAEMSVDKAIRVRQLEEYVDDAIFGITFIRSAARADAAVVLLERITLDLPDLREYTFRTMEECEPLG